MVDTRCEIAQLARVLGMATTVGYRDQAIDGLRIGAELAARWKWETKSQKV